MFSYSNITLQSFRSWMPASISAAMLRLDLLHPEISGNKWFKLKHNLEAAKAAGKDTIVTFGGAYSNHIAATAVACNIAGLKSVGIIRGERAPVLSHTLIQAQENGMHLIFVPRTDYHSKADTTRITGLTDNYYVIPEGGHNALGALGCEEILSLFPTGDFTHILCATGTGTTLAGLINSALPQQHVMGVAVLKGAQYLEKEITDLLKPTASATWELLHDYHGGGYAKISPGLIDFMNHLYAETAIPTDIIYTGKLVMAFREMLQQQAFPAGSKVLLIHTGGLQGNLSQTPGVLSF
ncbi:1-aminocyclopropane-1-carboxylate deaminase/D-cysteine desulfhydrase [Chitinophaga vietnamensis]|uniref:1-aminocyclopropane-1-carboxylate deaminase/D-cysteine desulfhydrase n=1 Tax=Chitinophaga vietnamensis TaxID=2593957 RepID=UPI00191C2458|nr:pyridoxal-phosphate dependent enzyme [Chitinophaga vietnamensis]